MFEYAVAIVTGFLNMTHFLLEILEPNKRMDSKN